MTEPQSHPATLRPGRPRSEEARLAILTAAAEAMRTVGLRRMTIEGIAAAAGVSKSTVYRWWKTKGTLALDAQQLVQPVPTSLPGTGSLRQDLLRFIEPLASDGPSPPDTGLWRQLIAEAQSDPELAAVVFGRGSEPMRAAYRPIFDAAVARGELAPDVDIDLVYDILFGTYFHRLLLYHGRLDRSFLVELVNLVLDGISARR